MAGMLFVVATPIGNLEDLTFRALRTLQDVDLVAAEDTRRTIKLLTHYNVRKPLVSLREHNEARETPRLIGRIRGGASIALVSDAGTPAIADPGARLVRAARDAGIRVVPIPGPSAITAALSISGFAGDSFVFFGFPPAGGTARVEWFERLQGETRISVCFESPHRIERTLADLHYYCIRPIIVNRELTKINEESISCPINAGVSAIGEFVLVIGPGKPDAPKAADPQRVVDIFGLLTEYGNFDEQSTVAAIASLLASEVASVRKALKKGRFW